ncbi:hypothetical protein BDV11DRAFT_197085 [Aspergillus similis]
MQVRLWSCASYVGSSCPKRPVGPCSAVERLPNGLGPMSVLVTPSFPAPCSRYESTILRTKGYH